MFEDFIKRPSYSRRYLEPVEERCKFLCQEEFENSMSTIFQIFTKVKDKVKELCKSKLIKQCR